MNIKLALILLLFLSPCIVSETKYAGVDETPLHIKYRDLDMTVQKKDGKVVIGVKPLNSDLTQQLTPKVDDANKTWTFIVTNGTINSEAWKDLPEGYTVIVITPVGTFEIRNDKFWDADKEKVTDTDPVGNLKAIDDFNGTISYDPAKGLNANVGNGAADFKSTSGAEFTFHKTENDLGLQYPMETSFEYFSTAPDTVNQLQNFSEVEPAPVAKGPGQS